MQGVAISFFVKTTKTQRHKEKQALADVYHCDLYGKRKDKYDFLRGNSLQTIPFEKLPNVAPMYFMVAKDFEAEGEYNLGFMVEDLFGSFEFQVGKS